MALGDPGTLLLLRHALPLGCVICVSEEGGVDVLVWCPVVWVWVWVWV